MNKTNENLIVYNLGGARVSFDLRKETLHVIFKAWQVISRKHDSDI